MLYRRTQNRRQAARQKLQDDGSTETKAQLHSDDIKPGELDSAASTRLDSAESRSVGTGFGAELPANEAAAAEVDAVS